MQMWHPLDLTQLPINITDVILKFRAFMIDSWPALDSIMMKHDWDNDGDFTDDWLQSNWEFLVERELLGLKGRLTPFGIRAKSHARSTKNGAPAYQVTAKLTGPVFNFQHQNISISQDSKLYFYAFSTFLDPGYGLYPPFDIANLVCDSSKELSYAPIDHVMFYLEEIDSSPIYPSDLPHN